MQLLNQIQLLRSVLMWPLYVTVCKMSTLANSQILILGFSMYNQNL